MSLTTQQLTTREQGIGSSDCAAAIGISPYKTRYELWLEKTGKAQPPNLDEIERIQWGNYLEPKRPIKGMGQGDMKCTKVHFGLCGIPMVGIQRISTKQRTAQSSKPNAWRVPAFGLHQRRARLARQGVINNE